ncbi:MAG: hypothetical protein IPL73_12795 [Candidatus Obscuribacter sp.]|nr:hypothetical protein [Candidatus Obscuribacter sp.]
MRTSLPVKAIASMGFCLLLVILLTGVSLIMAALRVGKDLVDPVAIAQAVKKHRLCWHAG